MEIHRVRTLIPFLDYKALTDSKILPDTKLFTQKTVPSLGGKTICPSLAKSMGKSDYGLYIEGIVSLILKQQTEGLTAEFDPLIRLLNEEFVDKLIRLKYQAYLKHQNIEGHPDFQSSTTIYDVKTTGQFGKMRTESIHQLLSYYCLAKLNNLNITSIGLILPLQLLVVTANLEKWNWKPFYQKLTETIDKKLKKEKLWHITPVQSAVFENYHHKYVGHHVHKDQLFECIKKLPAVQFFINGNCTSSVKYTQSFQRDLREAISVSRTPTFIHSPYALNLSQPGKKVYEKDNDKQIEKELGELSWGSWTFYCLKQLLEFGDSVGIRGVVVHCGKCCGRDRDTALEIMRNSIIACSFFATEKCKLLIETSAGQKGELLCDPEELVMFYLSLPDFVRKVVSICLDSAHTHGAGYRPYEFLEILVKNKVPIELVHYNDSKVTLGSCLDRHESVGHGHVGFDQLNKLLMYSVQNNIPLLTE